MTVPSAPTPAFKSLSEQSPEELSRCHAACFDDYWSMETFRDILNNRSQFGWCASIEGEIVGLAVFAPGGEGYELLTVCIDPDFRNQGIAKALLLHCFAEEPFAKSDKILLEVASDNSPALALYHQLGFSKDGIRKNYYRRSTGRIDAVLMSLSVMKDRV